MTNDMADQISLTFTVKFELDNRSSHTQHGRNASAILPLVLMVFAKPQEIVKSRE